MDGGGPDVYAKAASAYRDNLRRRFGKVPSWPELAKIEDKAVARIRPSQPQPARDNPNSRAAIQAIIAKGEATRASILAVLTQPMTCPDVATALKRSPQLVRRHLGLLELDGRVIGRSVKTVTIWERRQEAAE
jgi:hypothetical protein